jgi:PIN domain nuclease of toxin-antitoxin system
MRQLSPTAQQLLEHPEHTMLLSIASIWEMAIKVSLGKLNVPTPFTPFIMAQVQQNNIGILAITPEHTGQVATLPFHHRDPFDRLIIAQALVDQLPLLGADTIFDLYGVQRYW